MKTPRFFALLLAGLLAFLAPRPAEARVETSFDFFYDSLSPYGEWVQVADYGFCWRPTDVDEDWAPYSDGYWAFTDAGWTWVSYEDFGGIVYHYGRWVRTEDAGWCWVPDYEWGPAWVSWRNNDDYIGWAPLPPEARWQPAVGISVWVDRDCDIGPSYYSFCHVRDFGAPVLRPVIINRIENVTIIRRTVNITNITYNTHYSGGPVIYNGGPSFAFINERSSRRIPALKLVQNTSIDLNSLRDGNRGDRDRRRNFNGQAVGNQLVVTAPYVKPPTDPGFLRPQVKRVIGADKISRGWGMVKNDDVRREMKQEMQRQTKGATRDTAPARAVAVADLNVLPEKADPKAPSPVADRGNREGRDRDGRDSRDGRDNRDRSDRPGTSQPATAGQRAVTPPAENGTMRPTAETNRPPVQTEEKTGREKGRGPDRRDSQPPVAVDPTLKPFNPGNDPDSRTGRERPPGNPGIVPPDSSRDPRTAQPGDNGGRRRGSDEGAGRMKDGADQDRARQQAEAAAAQQKQQQQMDSQRQAEAQRQADALRQQKEAAAAAGRQRMQAEQDGAARQQAEQERRMQRDRSNADEQNKRAQDAEREGKRRQQMEAAGEQQRQATEQNRRAQDAEREGKRRQQMEAAGEQQRQAAEQMRRQAAEQQQRGQRDAEQQRRAQDGQRQQMDAQRQQFEAQREAQRQQRQQQQPPQPRQQPQQPQAQPQVAPPGATPADSDRERRKKRD